MYASTLTCVAALIELVGEFWCVPQLSQLQGGIVAKVTAPAYLLRSLVAVLLTKFFYNSTVTLMIIFGFCNLLFSLCIVVGFLFRCGKPLISLPTKVEFLSLRPFVVQTIIQWLFSQGERLLLTSSYNDDQIGVYGMVSDLCSLVARIIFAPIESSAFSLFAKSQNPPIEVLQICCRFVIYIGLLASSYGPVLGPVVLRKVYGPKWSGDDVKSVLSAFCRIMPFMALNGVTEAFPNARLPRNKLEVYNRKLLIVNVIYLTMMYWLGKIFGPHGAVYANGVAMSIRSCMAIHVIYLECGQAVKTIFPSAIVLAVLLLLSIFGNMLGAIVMIITIPIVAGIIIVFEKELLKKLIGMFRRTRKD
ncbi:protein RFT1 isoform X1 [Histomonas meleagridis]|uniref:protein RFT1-like isoform X1 n=1 Tax=Histomonas meleagridis TaxID=135588 RepID=UPI003559B9CE|nr:protein RFT1 isoform X1 [Histomonas meleagridis]KAH0801635.1 protein RFT1-like isoform X1 [Histomonas meleagridis]